MTSPRHKSLKTSALLLALVLPALRAAALDIAQPADDYFHGGAMHYLSNNIPAALNVVSNGLHHHPQDEKLQKLEALLKQQQQQKQQQNQNQQDKQQEQKEKEQQDKQDEQKPQQNQKPDQPKEDDQSKQQNSGTPKDQRDQGQQTAQSGTPEMQQEMTPEQALRVLDSTKGDEQVLPLQQLQRPPQSAQKFKDW